MVNPSERTLHVSRKQTVGEAVLESLLSAYVVRPFILTEKDRERVSERKKERERDRKRISESKRE